MGAGAAKIDLRAGSASPSAGTGTRTPSTAFCSDAPGDISSDASSCEDHEEVGGISSALSLHVRAALARPAASSADGTVRRPVVPSIQGLGSIKMGGSSLIPSILGLTGLRGDDGGEPHKLADLEQAGGIFAERPVVLATAAESQLPDRAMKPCVPAHIPRLQFHSARPSSSSAPAGESLPQAPSPPDDCQSDSDGDSSPCSDATTPASAGKGSRSSKGDGDSRSGSRDETTSGDSSVMTARLCPVRKLERLRDTTTLAVTEVNGAMLQTCQQALQTMRYFGHPAPPFDDELQNIASFSKSLQAFLQALDRFVLDVCGAWQELDMHQRTRRSNGLDDLQFKTPRAWAPVTARGPRRSTPITSGRGSGAGLSPTRGAAALGSPARGGISEPERDVRDFITP